MKMKISFIKMNQETSSNAEFSAKSAFALRGDLSQVRIWLLESDQLQVWRLRLCNV
jgi:hypothetical protein